MDESVRHSVSKTFEVFRILNEAVYYVVHCGTYKYMGTTPDTQLPALCLQTIYFL